MSTVIERILRLPREERHVLLDAVLADRIHNPISYVQTQMWALEQLNPGSPNHLVIGGWKLRGQLDIKAIEAAFAAVVAKHASLRTHFVDLGGTPLAVEIETPPRALSMVDLTDVPDNQQRLAGQILDNAVRPFDLERNPGFRAKLLRIARDEHALLYAAHHIVFDGWSQQLLARDLAEAYRKAVLGRPPILAPLRATYADFVEWQHSFMQSGAARDQLEFWRTTLGGELPVLELPFASPRPAARSEKTGTREFRLPPQTVAAIDAIARETRCARFPVLLAAIQSFLSRVTGQRDVILGTPVAGRPYADFEDAIGYFVNIVALRTSADMNITFRDLVHRVVPTVADALDNQELPFQSLLETLNLPRDTGQSPVFQAAFVYDNYPEQSLQLPGIETEPLNPGTGVSLYDVNVFARDLAIDPSIRVTYRADLYDDRKADRFALHAERWISDVARNPDMLLCSHSLLSPEERTERVTAGNQDRRVYDAPVSIHAMFEDVADRVPWQTALIGGGRQMTYLELECAANRLANRLLGLGVIPEMPVGIFLRRCPEMIVAMLAVLKAGGAYLPLDPSYPAARISHLLEDSGTSIVITGSEDASGLPGGGTIVRIDVSAALDDRTAERPHVGITGGNLLYVMYTSGSTGLPKGVMVTHGGVRNRLLTLQDDYRLTQSDRVLNKTTFSFDVSVWEIFLPLVTGAAVVLPAPETQKDSEAIVRAVRDFGVTMLHFIPPMLRLFLEEPGVTQCSSLRHVVSGGELLPLSLQRRFFELLPWSSLHNHYGPTEGSIEVTSWHCSRNDIHTNAPIGRAIANVPVYVLDDDLSPVPLGVSGELHFGGAAVSRGYWRAPGRTAERFLPDPFTDVPGARLYRTGDLVRYLEDGAIEFLGRVDHQVKIRGFRVELGEVQAVLEQHPAVLEALVDAEKDESGSSQLRAYLVRKGTSSAPEIMRWLADRLPEFMLPSSIAWLERMPLTTTGKIDRQALPPPSRRDLEAAYSAPRTDLERELCAMWSDALGAPELGIDDDFFAAGGHSLLGLRILFAMEHRFGVRIPLKSLLHVRTVVRVAALIEAETATAKAPSTIPAMPRDAQPVCSFEEERLWLVEHFNPGTPAYNVPVSITMLGNIDPQRLRAALDGVVACHDILRTSYVEEDGTILPRVASPAPIDWVDVDLSRTEESWRDAAWSSLLHERTRRPFALDGSLVRAALVRFPDNRSIFVLIFHHLVVDEWSTKILFEEISSAYAHGVGPPIREIQYRDYAYWEREHARDDAIAADLDYWTRQLAGIGSLPVPIPLDRPHPPVRSGRGGLAVRPVDADARAGLTAAARRYEVGEFALYAAAFAVLLSRRGNCNEVVIGTPVSCRDHPATESMIGFLLNQLPLRIEVRGNERFCDLALRVQQVVSDALDHRGVPFIRLVQHLNPCRNSRRNPVFDVVFEIEEDATPSFSIPGVSAERVEVDCGASKFDLELNLVRRRGEASLSLTYNRDILDRETAEGLLEELHAALDSIATEPEQVTRNIQFQSPEVRSRQATGFPSVEQPVVPLHDALTFTSRRFPTQSSIDTGDCLPPLGETERHRVLYEWNDTRADYPAGKCVHELFEAQAARRPEATAVVFEDEELSYAELNARANQLAHHLIALGVGPDDRVAICVERSLDMVVALLGVLKAGGAYVPLDPAYPAERLRFMIRDSRPAALITQSHLAQQFQELSRGMAVLRMTDNSIWRERPRTNPDPGRIGLTSLNLAYVIYTSGSTGVPKGVAMPHSALANLLTWQINQSASYSPQATLQFAALGFDVACQEVFSTLGAGGKLFLIQEMKRLNPIELLRFILASQIERLFLPYVAVQVLADGVADAGAGTIDGEIAACALKEIITAGEQLRIDPKIASLFGDMEGCMLQNQYGPTETHCATSLRLSSSPSSWPAFPPIGRPIANTRIYILDGDLEPVPIGVAGEIYIGGAGVARGYHNRPKLTAERFLADPFASEPGARMYRSGDLGRYLPDGNIEFLGRSDFQVKIRGFRVELGEIEARLLQHPAVREAVVVAREDAPGDKRLVAYYTCKQENEAETSAAALRLYLSIALPDAMVPAAYVRLDALPLTPNGKLDRNALPAPEGDSYPAGGYEPPQGAVEEKLAVIWAEALKLDRVGRNDNFFELGGHSLLAVRVVGRVRSALGVELPLRAFYEAPGFRQFAKVVNESPIASRRAEQVTTSAPMALAPAQEAIWFAEQLQPDTPMHNYSEAFLASGRINLDALDAALNHIASRHDLLRTVYRSERAGVRPVVQPGRFPLLRVAESSGSEEAISRHVREEIRRPFRLSEEWPVRARWVDFGGDRSLFIVTAHHIAYDGWSHSLFLAELSRFYKEFTTGCAHQPAPPRRQYADFAQLQREQLDVERVSQARSAWSTHLEGIDWNRTLPFDRRSSADDIAAASEPFTIDSPTTSAIQSCARRLSVTPFALLLAGFRCALAKWTGRLDDCIGTVAAGRPEAFEDVIGLFANPLPLFLPLALELNFKSWVQQCQAKVVEALSLQDVPISRALAGLRPTGEPRPEPPFEVTFALQESSAAAQLHLAGAEVRSVAAEVESATFPLQFFLTLTDGGLHGEAIYRRRWLTPQTVTALIGWFIDSVSRGVEDPAIQLRMLMEDRSEAVAGVVRGSRRRLPAEPAKKLTYTRLIDDGGPVVVSPPFREVDLAAFVRANCDEVRKAVREHGAVLFRGFGAVDERQFEAVATAVSGQLVPYVEGSSPRRRLGRGLYTSTEYPRELPISMHNELSYAHMWPRYLFFYCRVPPKTGGETPLADSHAVLQRLSPSLVDKFRARGVRYLRRLRGGPGLGLSWQEVFETEDREAVEGYCRGGAIAFEWTGDSGLRTSQRRHAVIAHPDTGKLCWFNQVHQWHSSNLGVEEARIIANLPPEERPLDATYGDGTLLEDETLAEIREAYAACQVTFRWEAGDIIAVDNIGTAHGRRPFSGQREVLVLLGGRVAASEVATI